MRHDFEERREARADRLEERADKARKESDQAFKTADSIASHIPFGQPILVGHHSEKRHRRDADKITRNMRKGIDLEKKADDLERRAEAARNNTAIFSDDPNAAEKLADRIARLEARQQMMRDANKLVRKGDREGLLSMGFSPTSVEQLLAGDFIGRKGFADYQLSNNNANIRRLKIRLQEQKKLESAETRETVSEATGIKIVDNPEANRTQIIFPDKPDAEVRSKLKRAGFRWSPTEAAWQRHMSSGARYQAEQIVAAIEGVY